MNTITVFASQLTKCKLIVLIYVQLNIQLGLGCCTTAVIWQHLNFLYTFANRKRDKKRDFYENKTKNRIVNIVSTKNFINNNYKCYDINIKKHHFSK